MNALKKIVMWPFRPLMSETAATGLIASAVIVYLALVLRKWMIEDVNDILTLIGLVFVILALPYGSIPLLARAGTRSFRDNTGSRAICELIGIFGLVCLAFIMHPML